MFNIQQWRALLVRRAAIDDETYWAVEEEWKEMTAFLLQDPDSTIRFLRTECTADDISWISEVFDGLVADTQSLTLVQALQKAINHYPEADKHYALSPRLSWAVQDFGNAELVRAWTNQRNHRQDL